MNSKFSIDYHDPVHSRLPHVVKTSGGKSSGMLLLKLLDAKLLDPSRGDCAIFNNTSREHALTYDFVRALRQRIIREYNFPFFLLEYCTAQRPEGGQSVTYRMVQPEDMKTDGSVFEEMISVRIVPGRYRRLCTYFMKVGVTTSFMRDWMTGEPGIPERGVSRVSKDIEYAAYLKRRGTKPREQ